MNFSVHISIGWPIALMLFAWLWLPLCVAIGNRLQMEWWTGVFALSVFAAIGLTVFALVYTLVTAVA